MAKANSSTTKETPAAKAMAVIRLFCEKAMGHGLVSTEEEKIAIENALQDLEAAITEG